ncbi:MAG: hypothetical protein K0U10_07250, partial [Gammaproteobacteria bacterium]|nr:hypothetical protein [Gammaproteobacteria bacterium]
GTSLKLNGSANINGEFDQQGLSLSYDHYALNLDHNTFSINLENSQGKLIGHHYFDFTKNTHFGNLDVENAQFLLKHSDLTFDDLKGSIEITPEYIYAPFVEASVAGLSVNSEFKLRYSNNGDLNLNLNLKQFCGQFNDFKTLFNTLGYTYIDKLPFSGELKINPNDAFFELEKKDENISTRVALGGELSNGTAPFIAEQPLTQVGCKFAFDSDTQIFEIQDFEGIWKSHRKQEYELYSNYLKINLFNDDPCHFDIKIKNSYKDCARLMGKLYFNVAQKKPTLKIVLDQKNNHVGSVGLTNVYFSLDEAFNLDYLNINFSGNLASLQQDIPLLQNMLPSVSSTSLTAFKWLSLDGDLSGQWVYDLNQKRHQFFIWGDQVKIGQANGGFFQLKGYQSGNSTVVEDLTYHDIKGGFKVEEKPFCFFIRDVELTANQDFDLQLSGIYCKIFNSFQADIKRLYCNLDKIKLVDPFSDNKYLKESMGKLDVHGKVEGGYFKGDINYGCEFKGKTSGLKVHDLLFQDDRVEGAITGNSQEFKVLHFESHFLEAFQQPLKAALTADNLEFRKNSEPKIGNIHFSVPVNSLQSIRSILKNKWQLEIPQSSFEIKKEGLLEGDIHFDSKNPNYSFGLKLQKGNYCLLERNYYLDQCRLDYGPLGLKIVAQTSLENKPYWFNYSKDSFKQDSFALTVYDQEPAVYPEKRLKIECLEEPGSIIIKSIKGSVAGLRWDFVHRPEKDTMESNVLMGQLQMQGDKLAEALPNGLGLKLKSLGLGKGYFLTGQLTLPKNSFQDFAFEGLFGGQDFGLLGFEFKSLSSIINCNKDHVEIKDLKLSDLSGELCVDSIRVDKGQFTIPKISLKDFKPSLLHRCNQGTMKHKPLIIDEFEVSNLKGDFNNLDTVKGDGYFTFQKSPKRQASLLDIPVHLISKLGLDLTMLNPVEGKVMFVLKDQKIVLTKLVDVYSHDRHCHFTLAKQPALSYMDFDGNLNVKIKMK